MATVLRERDREQLSISDGLRRIGVVLENATFLGGPISLVFRINDDDRLPDQLRSLAEFRAFRRLGYFKRRVDPHAQQWINQLRAYDAVQQGASEREIARTLFPRRLDDEGWREGSESVRSTVRRLIVNSRRMVCGGYHKLLA